MSDGARNRQGRSWQEGQAQEGQQAVRPLIFEELSFGREDLFMNEPARPDVLCTVCQTPEAAHAGRQHVFTPPGARVDTSQFAPKRRGDRDRGDDTSRRIPSAYNVTQTPFDPVLRQALIDKGVLTVEDLEAARKKIEDFTVNIMGQRPGTVRGAHDG